MAILTKTASGLLPAATVRGAVTNNILVYTTGGYPQRPSNEPHFFHGPVNPDDLGLMLKGDVWIDSSTEAGDGGLSYIRVSDVGDPETTGGAALLASYAARTAVFVAPPTGLAAEDTAAAQAAIDKAIADDAGALVFREGTYLLNNITVSTATDLVIAGSNTILQLNHGTNRDTLTLAACQRVTIRDLRFVGTSATSALYDSTNHHKGVDVRNCADITVEGCSFSKFTSQGIFAKDMQGGVATQGLRVDRCTFEDFTWDTATTSSRVNSGVGVALKEDAEYSTVTNCHFFRVSQAVRCSDGANSIIAHNIILDCVSGEVGTFYNDLAAIYCEAVLTSNAGKVLITGNKINHNESGQPGIIVKGDPAKPWNAYAIIGNDLLVNGIGTRDYQIVTYDAPRTLIMGNRMRAASGGGSTALVKLNTSNDSQIIGNFFRHGSYGVELDASTTGVRFSGNVWDSQITGKVLIPAGASIVNEGRTSRICRISSAGSFSAVPAAPSGWSVTSPATGHYTVTHDIGSANYVVAVEVDNSTDADTVVSVVRGSSSFDIYAKAAGVAAARNLIVTVTVSGQDGYTL